MTKSYCIGVYYLSGLVLSASLLAGCASPEGAGGALPAGAESDIEDDSSLADEALPAEEQSADVKATIEVDRDVFEGTDTVAVTITLTNETAEPVRLLAWDSGESGPQHRMFEIMRDGVAVSYTGRIYKRAAPTERDYLTLASGESISHTVELSGSYDFSETGQYSIRYTGALEHVGFEGGFVVQSADVALFIEGRVEAQTTIKGEPDSLVGGYPFCNATQKTKIDNADFYARQYANNASSYFSGALPTARYTKWFGVYTAGRWSTVSSHFAAIKSHLASQPMQYDCGCSDPNSYAYVYANQPSRIYLCGMFWSAPMQGSNSKADTIIHEVSHFYTTASTGDYAYGKPACSSLAITSPDTAIWNADNHAYFAANDPYLP